MFKITGILKIHSGLISLKTVLFLLLIVSGLLLTNQSLFAAEITGEEIMEKVDENQFLASARTESEMIIRDRDRETTKEIVSYVESDGEVTNALAEFVNPRDRGTKYLLLDDELWMHYPDAEELVRLSGHMLEEGMMGGDFSYQDALESEQLTELYDFELKDQEELEDRSVYVVLATAKEGEEVAYHQRQFWVDTERFVILQEEMYAREGRVLKELETLDVEEVTEGRWMPVEMVMEDKLREDTETIYRITEIEIDYDIPDDLLTLETLE